jgi:hypothetical protein
MRFALSAVGLVLGLILSGCNSGSDAASASPSGWKEFAPEQEKFSVRMPGDPAPLVGNDMSDSKAWTADGGNLVYLIRYKQLDPSIEHDQRLIEETFDTEFETMGITENLYDLEQKKELSVAGVSGREIVGTTADKKTKRIRICVAGGRLYRVEVTGANSAVASPDAEAFFNSLKIGR